MRIRRFISGVICCGALALAACHTSDPAPADMADPIHINKIPTGSIQTPSLCDRVQVDARVTGVAVDSFAFAWSGDHYEVVYADLAAHDLYGMRVSEAGVPTESPRMLASGTQASLPNIIMTTTGYLVTWEEATTPPRARVLGLDSTGAPTGTPQIVATARGAQLRPVLSQSPTGIAIAWMDQVNGSAANTTQVGVSTTYVALLDSQLHVRTDVPKIQVDSAFSTGYPWLAGNTTQLALLWSEQQGVNKIDTYFELLDGTLMSSAASDVRNAPSAMSSALLGRMVVTDFGFIGAWEDNRDASDSPDIYTALLEANGTLYGGGLVEEPNTGSANWPHIAWTGSAIGVVYYQFRSGKPQIFMTFIDRTGARIDGAADAQISNTTEWARFPDVAWTGSEFGVMWLDARDGEPELYFNLAACQVRAPT